MKNRIQNFDVIVSLLISILSGIGIEMIPNLENKSLVAFIVGSTIFFGIEIIRLRLSNEKLIDEIGNVSSQIRLVLEKDDDLDGIKILLKRYGIADYNSIYSNVTIAKDKTWLFWKDAFLLCHYQWLCTTYAEVEHAWHSTYVAEIGLAVQRVRIADGCKITRIFIYNSVDELRKIYKTMNQQEEIGIIVYWINSQDIMANSTAMKHFKITNTLDLAVIDDDMVLCYNLDEKNRDVTSSTLTKNSDFIINSKILLNQIRLLAKRFDKTEIETIINVNKVHNPILENGKKI